MLCFSHLSLVCWFVSRVMLKTAEYISTKPGGSIGRGLRIIKQIGLKINQEEPADYQYSFIVCMGCQY